MKIIELTAPVDNGSLGLKKGETYYVLTHAEGVDGLTEFVEKLIPLKEIEDHEARITALEMEGKPNEKIK
ncbi:hypothetical protein [Melissococcus plutonius]|uniref:hypothetical protein n=1 Tax=Melissococcus plutonius TaxID=33970 RepID=UPI003EE7EA19